MNCLLDTNAVIALLKGEDSLIRLMKRRRPADVGIPSIVAHELFFGAYKSTRRAENLLRVEALQLAVVDFDKEDARCAGEIRANLERVGMPIGPYDVLIAGQALSRSLTLLTRNTKEFARVEGLRIEDWEA